MKINTIEVRSGDKGPDGKKPVIGFVDAPEFAALEEAVDKLTAAKCLDLINRQYPTDLCNQFRAAHNAVDTPEKALRRVSRGLEKGTVKPEDALAALQAEAERIKALIAASEDAA